MFACIYIPDFPVAAIMRAEPRFRQRAVAVLEGKPSLLRVVALNQTARQLGMEVGMTKLQAAIFAQADIEDLSIANVKAKYRQRKKIVQTKQKRHQLPPSGAVLRQRSVEQENSAHAALLDVAHAFTPRVEDTAPGTLLLDLAGLERLYGAPPNMAHALASRVKAAGVEANLALAANPEAALHAARGFNGITLVPAGEEAQHLGKLPLHVLLAASEITQKQKSGNTLDRDHEKWRKQTLETLESWGVRDFRALAQLPAGALTSRLGEAGACMQRLARGANLRTLALCEPSAHFEEMMELESPVETLEPLSFVLNRLLEQLCTRLEVRALAAHQLHLRLQLERRVADEETTTVQELTGYHNVGGPSICERVIRMPVATRNAKVFLKLLQLELDAHPPGAPIVKVWITAQPAPPRSAQHGLFLPITPEAEKLEITLARIGGIVGERRAGIARLLDTHRRDAFRLEQFAAFLQDQKQKEYTPMWDSGGDSPLALRIFRPPSQLRIRLRQERPVAVAAMTRQSDRRELYGKIVWSAGPWRSSGDWWTENAKMQTLISDQAALWDREEWDVALTRGGGHNLALYRIYRELASGNWFADASYD